MATGVGYYFNAFRTQLMKKLFEMETDTIKCALLADTWTPDIDGDTFWSDISAHEVSGTGYVAGGQTCTTKTVSQDNTNNKGVFSCDDPQWATSTLTARYAVFYDTTAADRLIAYIDFGGNQTTAGTTFKVDINASGLLRI